MIVSRAVLLIFSIIIIGSDVSCQQYNIKMFIDDVSFIPGARAVLTIGYNALLLYNEYRSLVTVNGTDLGNQLKENFQDLQSEIRGMKSDVYKLSNDLNKLQSIITDNVVIDSVLDSRLNHQQTYIYNNFEEVDRSFDKMIAMNEASHTFETSTYDTFFEGILDPKVGQLSSKYYAIHQALAGRNQSKDNILDILANKHMTNSLVCRDEESPFSKISHLYTETMKVFTKGLIMDQFAYAYKRKKEKKPKGYEGESNLSIRDFLIRSSEIVNKIKNVMSRASTAFWMCKTYLQEDITFAKLGPIFQKYFLKEEDAKDNRHGCKSTCDKRKDEIITDKCISEFCQSQTGCSGVLVGCEASHPKMNICLADLDSGRRYHSIEGKDKDGKTFEFFGKKNTCRGALKAKKFDLLGVISCEFCKCTCLLDPNIKDIDRYFSLRSVTADVKNKKVVTGVRFAKKNHVFHIQIEEGTLQKDGVIDQQSTIWKPVNNFSIHEKAVVRGVDYHMIEWENRTVNLDDLQSTGDKVLTGLKLKVVKGALQLEIQVTPFNFTNGKLNTAKSEWISNNKAQRTEIDMSERDIPRANTYRHLDSGPIQFFKFTTSSFKDDVGQTVVPFIDLEEITTSFRMPLAGAGLIHQGNTDKSAGFLSFKLFNYNYAHHLGNL